MNRKIKSSDKEKEKFIKTKKVGTNKIKNS